MISLQTSLELAEKTTINQSNSVHSIRYRSPNGLRSQNNQKPNSNDILSERVLKSVFPLSDNSSSRLVKNSDKQR
ncbi:unnamed protein product [Ilex paraguariensis]|uniref:Uncharacterized protein n=1 Tax=Ilex paraguariensis TaxID=185542 RepID=A0ABC8TAR1_9AQUA